MNLENTENTEDSTESSGSATAAEPAKKPARRRVVRSAGTPTAITEASKSATTAAEATVDDETAPSDVEAETGPAKKPARKAPAARKAAPKAADTKAAPVKKATSKATTKKTQDASPDSVAKDDSAAKEDTAAKRAGTRASELDVLSEFAQDGATKAAPPAKKATRAPKAATLDIDLPEAGEGRSGAEDKSSKPTEATAVKKAPAKRTPAKTDKAAKETADKAGKAVSEKTDVENAETEGTEQAEKPAARSSRSSGRAGQGGRSKAASAGKAEATEQPESETTPGGRFATTALLFQAPDTSAGPKRRRVSAPAGPPEAVAPAFAGVHGRGEPEVEEDEETTESAQTAEKAAVTPEKKAARPAKKGSKAQADSKTRADSKVETEDDPNENTDETDSDTDSDSDDGASSGQRRRRRRGGRGRRGRGSNGPDDSDDSDDSNGDSDSDSESDEDDSDEQAEDGNQTEDRGSRSRSRGGRGSGRKSGDDAEGSKADSSGDDSDDGDDNDDGDDVSGEGGSSSRRRRRRRGGSRGTSGSGGSGGSGRSGDSESSSGGNGNRNRSRGTGTGTDEITPLKGSTRLEAKRQRRRDGREAGRRRTVVTEAEFLARRESVDRTMIVREMHGRTQIAVLEDSVLVEHYVSQQEQASVAGNVYLGRVQNVLPSMEAAFIDIGKGRNAVLYAGEVNWDAAGLEGQPRRIEQALKSGDSVLVQVTKDPIGHKGARLTSQVTLAGRYLVYVPGGGMTGISRKLPDNERSRLKKLLRELVPENAGVIVRTAAEGASEEELRADIARLQDQWTKIEKKSKTPTAPALLQGEPDLAIRVVRDIFNDDFKSLVISGQDAWDEISGYVGDLAPDLAERVTRWTDNQDVFVAHRVDEQLAKGMDRKVWLPSGGSLVIDRTEAMTVVDVNTGKFTGSGGTLEETVTRNNLEAAEEIVRQLRLRDIGGMIVIDFIDMVLESNRDLVLRRMVEALGRDRTKHQVAEVTSLGLVQMTRKRVGQGLVEAFSETCDHCNGRGFIVHSEPNEKPSGGSAGQHGGSENDSSDDSKRSRRKRSGGGGKSSAPAEVAGKDVPTIPDDDARASVKATLATIAAAAAHAHEQSADGEGSDKAGSDKAGSDKAGSGRTGSRRASSKKVTPEEELAPEEVAPEQVTEAEKASFQAGGKAADDVVAKEPVAASEPVANEPAAEPAAKRTSRRAGRPAAATKAVVGSVGTEPGAGKSDADKPAVEPAAAKPVAEPVAAEPAAAEPQVRRARRAASKPAGAPKPVTEQAEAEPVVKADATPKAD